MKVGLSLSFCVKDIMQGKVELSSVECIVAGTQFSNLKEFEKVLNQYADSYWSKDPEQGKCIAKYLWEKQRIHQPRLTSADAEMPSWHRNIMSQGIHWLDVWRP